MPRKRNVNRPLAQNKELPFPARICKAILTLQCLSDANARKRLKNNSQDPIVKQYIKYWNKGAIAREKADMGEKEYNKKRAMIRKLRKARRATEAAIKATETSKALEIALKKANTKITRINKAISAYDQQFKNAHFEEEMSADMEGDLQAMLMNAKPWAIDEIKTRIGFARRGQAIFAHRSEEFLNRLNYSKDKRTYISTEVDRLNRIAIKRETSDAKHVRTMLRDKFGPPLAYLIVGYMQETVQRTKRDKKGRPVYNQHGFYEKSLRCEWVPCHKIDRRPEWQIRIAEKAAKKRRQEDMYRTHRQNAVEMFYAQELWKCKLGRVNREFKSGLRNPKYAYMSTHHISEYKREWQIARDTHYRCFAPALMDIRNREEIRISEKMAKYTSKIINIISKRKYDSFRTLDNPTDAQVRWMHNYEQNYRVRNARVRQNRDVLGDC